MLFEASQATKKGASMGRCQLTEEERYQISALLSTGQNASEIATQLGRHKSTICREIKRNTGQRGYRPKQANETALKRRRESYKAIKMTGELAILIEMKIRENWSPEQIAGYLKKHTKWRISHESIYQYILKDKEEGGTLYQHLRCQKKRRKRYGTKARDRRGQIPNRKTIDERPEVVEERSRIGDWEGDTIIGKNHKGALVTLVDRTSRKLLAMKVPSKEAEVVKNAVISLLKGECVETVTFDNGKEFSFHEEIAKKLDTTVYFAHPYSSWERGSNENTNGLLRQYFRKGSCLKKVTQKDVDQAVNQLNSRPRKTIGYETPNAVHSRTIKTTKVAIAT
jgi:transposase, IS30 family